MRWEVVSFGETMIRLAVPLGERLETTRQLEVGIGGTEANVLVALARLGRRTAWASVLPQNPLGERIARELAWHGVDVSLVQWVSHGRIGIYFLDTGVPPRPTVVLYDRARSAIALVDPMVFPTDWIVDTGWLHLTGITPALSEGCQRVAWTLLERARVLGVPISFDVNYRSRLWGAEEAARVLAPFCAQTTILLCGEGDARTLWGLAGEPEQIAAGLAERFRAPVTVVTLGDGGAVALTRDGDKVSVGALPATVIDRVGAGDAFAAGFLHGYVDDRDLERAMRYGTALAALKLTIRGDLALVSAAELEAALAETRRTIVR